jgi:hypothetical protein
MTQKTGHFGNLEGAFPHEGLLLKLRRRNVSRCHSVDQYSIKAQFFGLQELKVPALVGRGYVQDVSFHSVLLKIIARE